jgi:hypothetical protein
MKATDHPTRHPSVHPGDRAKAATRRVYLQKKDEFGRGQDTVLGWSDPGFGQPLVAKRPRGSLQPNEIGDGRLPADVLDSNRSRARRKLTQVKNVRISVCTSGAATSSPAGAVMERIVRDLRQPGKRRSPRKKVQNGRERPHFFGFQPPKKFAESLPPLLIEGLRGCKDEPESLSDSMSDIL